MRHFEFVLSVCLFLSNSYLRLHIYWFLTWRRGKESKVKHWNLVSKCSMNIDWTHIIYIYMNWFAEWSKVMANNGTPAESCSTLKPFPFPYLYSVWPLIKSIQQKELIVRYSVYLRNEWNNHSIGCADVVAITVIIALSIMNFYCFVLFGLFVSLFYASYLLHNSEYFFPQIFSSSEWFFNSRFFFIRWKHHSIK